jgi:hexulose-6-phosphate isomerase
MKKSISYWAFPDGLAGTRPIVQTMVEAKAAGFEAIELCCADQGVLTPAATQKECAAIRAAADKAGIQISSLASGIYWGYNLGCNTPADRQRAEATVKKMLQVAAWLGVDALLYIPVAVDVFFNPASEVIPYDVALERAVKGTERLLKTAEKCRVALCVENVWNKFLLSPTEMRDFVDRFGTEWVGAYFDVGNVMPYGYPEQWIRVLGRRIRRVHFKDFRRAVADANGFCDLLEGDVNWPAVMAALKEAGYDGYCTAEMIPLYAHYPMVRVSNTSRAMDAIFGRAV